MRERYAVFLFLRSFAIFTNLRVLCHYKSKRASVLVSRILVLEAVSIGSKKYLPQCSSLEPSLQTGSPVTEATERGK